MCLLLIAKDVHPDYSLIVASNRDEFYNRPTKEAHFWESDPGILGGRDSKGSGTWLGVTKSGRFSAITNFREPSAQISEAPSRGLLVSGFLENGDNPETYLKEVELHGYRYNGFNILTGDINRLLYFSNRSNGVKELTAGIYGICNHLIDTPWPKVEKSKSQLKEILEDKELSTNRIFDLLSDRTQPHENMLPDTGVGIEWEKILSSIFITSKIYGTRSSTVISVSRNGIVEFQEKTYLIKGEPPFKSSTRTFKFTISD